MKIVLLQLRTNVFEQITADNFDFNSLSYYDINSQLKGNDSTDKSTSIMYLVDSYDDIPEAIYKHIQVDKNLL